MLLISFEAQIVEDVLVCATCLCQQGEKCCRVALCAQTTVFSVNAPREVVLVDIDDQQFPERRRQQRDKTTLRRSDG